MIIDHCFLAMSKDTLRIIFDIIPKFSDSSRNALFQRSFTGATPAQHRHLFVLEGIISSIFTLGTHPFCPTNLSTIHLPSPWQTPKPAHWNQMSTTAKKKLAHKKQHWGQKVICFALASYKKYLYSMTKNN